jgi:hypothetical protein
MVDQVLVGAVAEQLGLGTIHREALGEASEPFEPQLQREALTAALHREPEDAIAALAVFDGQAQVLQRPLQAVMAAAEGMRGKGLAIGSGDLVAALQDAGGRRAGEDVFDHIGSLLEDAPRAGRPHVHQEPGHLGVGPPLARFFPAALVAAFAGPARINAQVMHCIGCRPMLCWSCHENHSCSS